MQPYSVFI